MKKQLKLTIEYFAIGYVTAFLIEFFSAASGDSQLFESAIWLPFFIIWYGSLLLIHKKFLYRKAVSQILLIWAILGPVLEIILFRGSFLITDIFYGLIFLPATLVTRTKVKA